MMHPPPTNGQLKGCHKLLHKENKGPNSKVQPHPHTEVPSTDNMQ